MMNYDYVVENLSDKIKRRGVVYAATLCDNIPMLTNECIRLFEHFYKQKISNKNLTYVVDKVWKDLVIWL